MSAPNAKEIAKQLDRRQLRRKILLFALVIAAIVAAISYLTCGQGFGLGGKGKGSGAGAGPGSGSGLGSQPLVDAGPKRCAIRIAAAGTTVDGKTATIEEVIAVCKATTGADVVVTGDARQGDWDTLRAALEAAEVPIEKR